MLFTACQSIKYVETERVIVPSMVFPVFPLADSMTNNADGTVTVPAAWIVQLEEYRIRITATETEYDSIKSLYENQK